MSNFAVLNEEEKILRRKEKEAERQRKIREIVEEVGSRAPKVGSWADASDEEAEERRLHKAVSDSESDAGDSDSDWEGKLSSKPAKDLRQNGQGRESALPKTPIEWEETKMDAHPTSKSKKDRKKEKKFEDEDLDQVLAEFGIDLGGDEAAQPSASSKRRQKKKEREAAGGEVVGGNAAPTVEEKDDKTPAAKESELEDEIVDEAKRQQALQMLKKKQASKGKKGPGISSDAVKAATAEAKKRVESKKVKRDKSGYDR